MIPQIISGVVSLATGWMANKKEKQVLKHQKELEVISSTSNWEELQASNSKGSFKDEWFTLILSVPMVGAFFPQAVAHIQQGFVVLEGMPDFYKGFLGAAIAASFGVRALTKWGSK